MVSLYRPHGEEGVREAWGAVCILSVGVAEFVEYSEVYAQSGDGGELGVAAFEWEGMMGGTDGSFSVLVAETRSCNKGRMHQQYVDMTIYGYLRPCIWKFPTQI